MEPFCFTVHDFKVEWLDSGPRQGMARGFQAPLTYRDVVPGDPSTWSPEQTYDLRVNHPLTIGGTQIFLIGHGYAPVITVRDAAGPQALRRADDLPARELQLRVVRRGQGAGPHARPGHRARGACSTRRSRSVNGDPVNVMGDDRNPTISMLAYVGDLGLDSGVPQSVYAMDKAEHDAS